VNAMVDSRQAWKMSGFLTQWVMFAQRIFKLVFTELNGALGLQLTWILKKFIQ